MHSKLAHLSRAIEPALNITSAPAGEVRHRQRQHLPAEKIEDRSVEANRSEREQIFLREGGGLHKNERCAHSEQNCFQQSDIFFDDDFVDDHLGEDGKEQLQKRDRDREQEDLQQDRAEFFEERHQPLQAHFCLGRFFKLNCVIEERGVARPVLFEIFARDFAQAERRISDFHVGVRDVVEHHPVIAFPMHDRRQRHDWEIADRNFERACSESELRSSAT